MQQLWIEIPPELDGLRADRALPQLLDEYSRSFVQQLLEEQHILLSDRPLKKSRTVKAGERFFVEIPDRHGTGRKPDFITAYVNEAIGLKL